MHTEFVTAREIAKAAGVSPSKITYWAMKGFILEPTHKVGPHLYYSQAEADVIIEMLKKYRRLNSLKTPRQQPGQ